MPSTNRDDQTNASDDQTRRRHRRPRRNRLPIPQRQVDYWRELAGPPATGTAPPSTERPGTEDVPVLGGEQGVCGNCHLQGHKVIDCWRPSEDGLIHGCGVCNSSDHETKQCPSFPTHNFRQVKLLVWSRENLPPLATPHWYPILYEHMDGLVDGKPPRPPRALPWSEEYSMKQANDTDTLDYLQDNLRDNHVYLDPALPNWEAAKQYFGGIPPIYKVALDIEKAEEATSSMRPSMSYNRITTSDEQELIIKAVKALASSRSSP